MKFYSDPIGWTKTAIKFLADPNGTTNGNPELEEFRRAQTEIQQATKELESVISQISSGEGDLQSILNELDGPLGNVLAYALADDLIDKIAVPLSLKTGAPVGEWHLVVGNPMNPIAMIGNLICQNVSIEFGEVLGPDDFPTEVIATFTLQHGRDRERGEIESIFNRGDGRLYQSNLPTYSNTQSLASVATTAGGPIPVDQTDSTLSNPYLFTTDYNFTPNE